MPLQSGNDDTANVFTCPGRTSQACACWRVRCKVGCRLWLTFLRIQCSRTKLRMLEAQNSSEAKLALAGIFGNTNAAGGYQDTWPKLRKGKDHRANRPLECRKIEITLGALRAPHNNLQRSKAVPIVHSKDGSLLVCVNLGLSRLLFARPASHRGWHPILASWPSVLK